MAGRATTDAPRRKSSAARKPSKTTAGHPAKTAKAKARPRSTRPKRALRPPPPRRYAVVYDIDGPRVRLGVLWFVLNVAALVLGLGWVAGLYAATAAIAALQTVRSWRARRVRPSRGFAAVAAAVLPIAAAVDTAVLGGAVVGLAIGAVVAAFLEPRRAGGVLAAAGYNVQCSLFVGLAAACVVVAYRFEIGAAVALVLVVAAYDSGDFLIGTGSSNHIEGPVAGAAGILVAMFAVAALGVPPFEFPSAFAFAGLAVVLCPAGQLLASAILPAAAAPAPALRRLDSMLLLAPAWAWSVGWYAANHG
jgi:hypothetical protein